MTAPTLFDIILSRGRILLAGRRLANDKEACRAAGLPTDVNPNIRFNDWLKRLYPNLGSSPPNQTILQWRNMAEAIEANPELEQLVRDKRLPMSSLYQLAPPEQPAEYYLDTVAVDPTAKRQSQLVGF